MSASDSYDDNSSVYSDTSTLVYDHEPFSIFRERVLQLAIRTVWPDSKPEQIKIERLAGGGLNRIIGLSLERDGSKTDYILRVPRFKATQIDHDVAALLFVERNTSFPVPQVVMFDETEDNELGEFFMIQRRLEGASCYATLPSLDDEARRSFATQLGRIYREMLSISSSVPGRLQLPPDWKRSLDEPIHIGPIGAQSGPSSTVYASRQPTMSPELVIKEAFESHMAPGQEDDPNQRGSIELRDALCSMAKDVYASGMVADDGYSLAHLDFAPRNILVETDPSSSRCKITGVLDWDSAVFAPRYMSCKPPMWLWAWQDDDNEDESLANEVPESDANKRNKADFESAAGEGYLEKAYKPEYRLARRLFQIAVNGVGSNEDEREAIDMMHEWKSLRTVKVCQKLCSVVASDMCPCKDFS